jgi:hypothetical protein
MVLGLAAMAVAMVAAPWARAQDSLSDRITRVLQQGQTNDLQRRFGGMLVDNNRDLEIDPAAGVSEARQTLLRRAAVYEKIKDFERAESDLTTALQLEPPTVELYVARGYFYMRRSRFTEALGDFLSPPGCRRTAPVRALPPAARGRGSATTRRRSATTTRRSSWRGATRSTIWRAPRPTSVSTSRTTPGPTSTTRSPSGCRGRPTAITRIWGVAMRR